MSQGDYIRLKKIKTRLCNDLDVLPPVLSSKDYTEFAAFSVESTVVNTVPINTMVNIDNEFRIFDIPQQGTLPTFPLCNDTNERTNRVLNPPNSDCHGLVSPSNQPHQKTLQEVLQCKGRFPYRTVQTNPLIGVNYLPYRWPGDNRVKRSFSDPVCIATEVVPRVIYPESYRNDTF